MRAVITALLAGFGAKLATVVGSLLPVYTMFRFLASPGMLTTVRHLTMPSVMITAVLFGWLLKRWRPLLSAKAVVAGLIGYTLLPLLALAGEGTIAGSLLGCAAAAIVAMSFGFPIAWSGGMLATVNSRLGYVVAVCALFPVVAWWGAGVPGAAVISVAPLSTRVDTAFVPPSSMSDGKSFDVALRQALREGRVSEDPRMHALRVAVVEGASALRATPCDQRARSQLRVAVLDFITDLPPMADRTKVERFTAVGETRQVSSALSEAAGKAALEALRGGVVTSSDMPAWARPALTAEGIAAMPDKNSPLRCR